jgi:hypothetical protein
MALTKEQKKRFLPDLLPINTIIEVIRVDKDGNFVKKEMTFGEFKGIKKRKDFSYIAYQKGFSMFFDKN